MLSKLTKKILVFGVILLSVINLVGCSNKDFFTTTHTFKHATIKMPDGKIVKGNVKKWSRTKEGTSDTLVVTLEDNKGTYLVHSSNVVLYNDKEDDGE